MAFSELVEKLLAPEERLNKINEKKNENTVKKESAKTNEDEDEDENDMDIIDEFIKKNLKSGYNPEELTYQEAQNKYGLVFNHIQMVNSLTPSFLSLISIL